MFSIIGKTNVNVRSIYKRLCCSAGDTLAVELMPIFLWHLCHHSERWVWLVGAAVLACGYSRRATAVSAVYRRVRSPYLKSFTAQVVIPQWNSSQSPVTGQPSSRKADFPQASLRFFFTCPLVLVVRDRHVIVLGGMKSSWFYYASSLFVEKLGISPQSSLAWRCEAQKQEGT